MSWFHPEGSARNPTYVVVSKGGRTHTVVDEPPVRDPNLPQFDFQYKFPISKYSTLASVAQKRKPTSSTQKPRVQVIDIGRGITDPQKISPERVLIAPKLTRKPHEPPDTAPDDFFAAPLKSPKSPADKNSGGDDSQKVKDKIGRDVDKNSAPKKKRNSYSADDRFNESDGTCPNKDGKVTQAINSETNNANDSGTNPTRVSPYSDSNPDEKRSQRGTISSESKTMLQHSKQGNIPSKVGSLYTCYITPLPSNSIKSMSSKYGQQYYDDASYDDVSDDVTTCDESDTQETDQLLDLNADSEFSYIRSLARGERFNPFALEKESQFEENKRPNIVSELATLERNSEELSEKIDKIDSNPGLEGDLNKASNIENFHGHADSWHSDMSNNQPMTSNNEGETLLSVDTRMGNHSNVDINVESRHFPALNENEQHRDPRLEKEYNTLKTKESEDQVEIRRLRTENRLLRQRVENLEKETATLADRLIHDQVKCAQQDEQILTLRKDLSRSRTESSQTNMKLEEVTEQYENLRRSNSSASSQASSEGSLPEADQSRVQKLQQENTELRAKDVDNTALIKQLRIKISELESRVCESSQTPSEELQSMQEELIACKLREAEANLSLKELQQKVIELKQHWQKHIDKLSACNPLSKAPKNEVRLMSDEVMSVRIREAQAVAELKDTKQRVMEMETQSHIAQRQVKRLEEENQRLRDELDEAASQQNVLRDQLQDAQRKENTLESKSKEDEMMQRLKDAEHSQLMAEMRQRIAELEIQTQEYETAGQLRGDTGELQNRIAELQDEVLQLKMSKRLGSLSAMVQGVSLESESECEDDLDTHLRTHELTLTESCCGFLPEGLSSNSYHHQRPTCLEDSSGEDTVEEGTESKPKQKRKNKVDLDRTPTQDIMNNEFFLSDEIDISKNCDSKESNPSSDNASNQHDDSVQKTNDPSTQSKNSDEITEDPLAGLNMDSSVYLQQTSENSQCESDTNNQTNFS